jgi:hypothetical protein
MEQKKKSFGKGGRKPKLDPRTHRYSLNLDDVENAKFLAFYDQSGYRMKAHFIKNCIFGKSFKMLKIDKSKVDYYIQLSQLFSQFRNIGILYNQTVKELHSNFTEKKALALLYKLEQYTMELVKTNQQIIALTKQFEASYKEERIISKYWLAKRKTSRNCHVYSFGMNFTLTYSLRVLSRTFGAYPHRTVPL